MYYFNNDYSEGCHPKILEALTKANAKQHGVYGLDRHSDHGKDLIRQTIQCPEADVHFLVGGTQTNLTSIAAFLRPHQAVIATVTGHINTHETGAIEATGHKVVALPSSDGKVTPAMIKEAVEGHPDEHMVQPKMVYISNATEVGTIYSKEELKALKKCCKKYGLYLYLDGARLGSALACPENDLSWKDLPRLTDAFYIGGTKNGALLGEALVIVNDALKEDFRYLIKQHGGMYAKGAFLGIQFEELFQNDLYMEIARHENKMADLLREGFRKEGFSFLIDSPSNQMFPILSNETAKNLKKKYSFNFWSKLDDTHSCYRFVTSWFTKQETIERFLSDLAAAKVE